MGKRDGLRSSCGSKRCCREGGAALGEWIGGTMCSAMSLMKTRLLWSCKWMVGEWSALLKWVSRGMDLYLCGSEDTLEDEGVGVVAHAGFADFVGGPARPCGGDSFRAEVEGVAEWFVEDVEYVTAGHEHLLGSCLGLFS